MNKVFIFNHVGSNTSYSSEIQAVFSMLKQAPTPELLEARAYGKGSDLYEKVKKEQSKAVKWGFYNPKRSTEQAAPSNNLVYIDIDADEVLAFQDSTGENIANHLKEIPYIFAFWRSFGGIGYSILCKAETSTEGENRYGKIHDLIGLDIAKRFGVIIDPSCADPDRLAVMSRDPELWQNENAEYFQVTNSKEYKASNEVSVFKKFNSDRNTDVEIEQTFYELGWSGAGKSGQFTRPGKGKGISALFNHTGRHAGTIHIFTSEDSTFEQGHYDKAAFMCFAKFSGNYSEFAKFLAKKYETYKPKTTPESINFDPKKTKGVEAENPEVEALLNHLSFVEAPPMELIKIEHFPPLLGYVIDKFVQKTGAAQQFCVHGAVQAIAAATCGKLWINVNSTYRESPVLYSMTLGFAGDGKSFPMKFFYAPLAEIQSHFYKKYLEEKAEFKETQRIFDDMGRDEKKATSLKRPEIEPEMRITYLTTGTMEGRYKALQKGRFLSEFSDEIESFLGGMDAYRGGKGGDLSVFLQMFNRQTITRVLASGTTHIESPFFCVSGTGIEEKIVNYLNSNSLKSNGFYERFLYFFPCEGFVYQDPTRAEAAAQMADTLQYDWGAYVMRMFNYFFALESDIYVNIGSESLPWVEQFEAQIRDTQKAAKVDKNDALTSMYSKIKIYFYRFLVLFWAARNFGYQSNGVYLTVPYDFEISLEDYSATATMINYIISTHLRIYSQLHGAIDYTTLTKKELSEYRKKTAILLRQKSGNQNSKLICDAVNALTKNSSPVNYRTVANWLNKQQ